MARRIRKKDVYDVCRDYVLGNLTNKNKREFRNSKSPFNYYNATGYDIPQGGKVAITGCLFANNSFDKCYSNYLDNKTIIILNTIPENTYAKNDFSANAVKKREEIETCTVIVNVNGGIKKNSIYTDTNGLICNKDGIAPKFEICMWKYTYTNNTYNPPWSFYLNDISFTDSGLHYNSQVNYVSDITTYKNKEHIKGIIDSSIGIYEDDSSVNYIAAGNRFATGLTQDQLGAFNAYTKTVDATNIQYCIPFFALTLPYQKEKVTDQFYNAKSTVAISTESVVSITGFSATESMEKTKQLADSMDITFNIAAFSSQDANTKAIAKTDFTATNDGKIFIEDISFEKVKIADDTHLYANDSYESCETDGNYYILAKSTKETIDNNSYCYCALKKLSATNTNLLISTVSAAWTMGSTGYTNSPISVSSGTIQVYSPLSKSGDTLSVGTTIVAIKDTNSRWILLNASCE